VFDYYSIAYYSAPATGFSASGPANPDDWYAQVVTEVDDWIANDHPGTVAVWVEGHTFANANSLEYCAYEGGPGLQFKSYDKDWIWYIHEHPAYYGASMVLQTTARESGIDVPVHYLGPMSWNADTDPGFWGIKRTMNEPEVTARKWQAFVDWQHLNNRWHT
jgi:hypothetical protein